MSKDITQEEIDSIMQMGSYSPFQQGVKQAQDGSEFLRKKADYNQIKSLGSDNIDALKRILKSNIKYIKKRVWDQYPLKGSQGGRLTKRDKEVNLIIESLKKDEELNKLRENQESFLELLDVKLQEFIAEKEGEITQKEQENKEEIQRVLSEKPFGETRIVWASPTQSMDLERGNVDQFIYSGKTKEKTVFIPFRDIHEELIQDNYRLRNGKSVKNIIVGSFVFIISTDVHPGYDALDEQYEGGRTWVEVPIRVSGKNFLRSETKGAHSEAAIKELLEDGEYIDNLVSDIKDSIKAKLETDDVENIKIYHNTLFLNSELSACKTFGCSETLYNIQRGMGELPFLQQLQGKLLDSGFILSRKEGGLGSYEVANDGDGEQKQDLRKGKKRLRMQVSYSAGRTTNSDGGYGTHAEEASRAIHDGELYNLPIDVHGLKGEVLLETPNQSITGAIIVSEYEVVKKIKSERASLFESSLLDKKGLEEITKEQAELEKQWQDKLNPKRVGFASKNASTKDFSLKSWGQKVLKSNDDDGQFL